MPPGLSFEGKGDAEGDADTDEDGDTCPFDMFTPASKLASLEY